MNVLLLSAYAAESHVHWQRSLGAMFPDYRWRVLSLPPRYFSWRVRGNPLYWALEERTVLEGDYDLLVATSMVDVATLRGLVPALARLPTLLYFHENQFDYPQQRGQSSLLEAQMVSLYSALASDRIAFNSAYNRDTFLAGLGALLRKLPDKVPVGVVEALAQRAVVLPVPFDSAEADAGGDAYWPGPATASGGRPVRLLWSGRFEHDKGGDILLHTLLALEAAGVDFEVALTGQQFRHTPEPFALIESRFAHRLVHVGHLPSASFRALQRAADIVLSTALHEFQGLAVMQAVAQGCLPAVPGRQVYPELYPARFCYASSPGDPAREGAAAAQLVATLAGELGQEAPDVSAFSAQRLRPRYARILRSLA